MNKEEKRRGGGGERERIMTKIKIL